MPDLPKKYAPQKMISETDKMSVAELRKLWHEGINSVPSVDGTAIFLRLCKKYNSVL